MRHVLCFLLVLLATNAAAATNGPVSYQVNGERFTGYFLSPADRAPLVVLVHDWDGLTGYEVKRAEMLAGKGYAVFAVDLFGAGVRPTAVEDKKRLTTRL
ncbi:MAG: dienelactone hydrolase family protein, partial [Desulfobulbus sp.]|nr:dienelactone hydrolase family protein [Desulfobulbus sp.]